MCIYIYIYAGRHLLPAGVAQHGGPLRRERRRGGKYITLSLSLSLSLGSRGHSRPARRGVVAASAKYVYVPLNVSASKSPVVAQMRRFCGRSSFRDPGDPPSQASDSEYSTYSDAVQSTQVCVSMCFDSVWCRTIFDTNKGRICTPTEFASLRFVPLNILRSPLFLGKGP